MSKKIIFVFAFLLAFSLGEALGSKWAVAREIDNNFNILVNSEIALQLCKTNNCPEIYEKTLASQSELALENLSIWIDAESNISSRIFYYLIWPSLNYFYAFRDFDETQLDSMKKARDLYNCKLKRICNEKMH